MKMNVSLIVHKYIYYAFIICSIFIISSCSDKFEENRHKNVNIRLAGLDMKGVKGFAVVENQINTKASSDTTTTAPYSLYSIDENGDIKLSIFYFEVITNEDDEGNVTQTQIQKEISDALQVVPSLVTDFGKNILFSGCRYELNDAGISDEARAICYQYLGRPYSFTSDGITYDTPGEEEYVGDDLGGDSMVYMIRKSDGALFDLSGQSIFTYQAVSRDNNNGVFTGFYTYWYSSYFVHNASIISQSIPPYRYMTSPSGNFYVQSCETDHISIIVDNGDAIDVKQLTQDYLTYTQPRFCIDKNDDIYMFYKGYDENGHLERYDTKGGFTSIDLSRYSPPAPACGSPLFFDMQLDNDGNLLIFQIELDQNSGERHLFVGSVINDVFVEYTRTVLPEYTTEPYLGYSEAVVYPHFIGGNGDFSWFLPQEFWEGYYHVPGDPYYETNFRVMTYIPETREFKLEDLPDELIKVFIRNYDALLSGVKSYGVNVRNSTIEVTEIDVIDETYRQYSFEVDLSSMTAMHYTVHRLNGFPYLIINGKSKDSGADVLFKINLATGENNSTFGKDGRKVTSFFKIN